MTRLTLMTLLIPAAVSADEPTRPKLAGELKRRVAVDQKLRFAMLAARGKEKAAAIQRVVAADKENTAWLRGVVAEGGWPGRSVVGEAGAHNAWLLVQHADRAPAFQKKCLKLIAKAAAAGEASKRDLAYLTDRVRRADGMPQVYGTQLHTVDGELVPQPIEDADNVDSRRKAAGMIPLAEYLKFARRMMKSGGEGKNKSGRQR